MNDDWSFVRISSVSGGILIGIAMSFVWVHGGENLPILLAQILAQIGATIISISFAVAILLVKLEKDEDRHEQNQIGMLLTLSKRMDLIHEDIKGYEKSLEKVHIPLFPIKKINAEFYLDNLDFRIEGKETEKLKEQLFKVDDKITLINNYQKRLIDTEYSDLKKKDEIFNIFLTKIRPTVKELRKIFREAELSLAKLLE